MTTAATHSWPARIVRVIRAPVRDGVDDDLGGEAAKVAYYFFLSLFPFVLVVFALTGLGGGDAASARITLVLESAVPRSAGHVILELIAEVSGQPQTGVLSLGIVLTLWAALSGAWLVLRWPLAIALLTGAAWLAYYYLPARNQRQARGHALAGALVAMALWLLATGLFRVYVTNFGPYGSVYGAVGAVIVLLIWFYISAFAVLVGGEVGGQLERERLGKDSPASH